MIKQLFVLLFMLLFSFSLKAGLPPTVTIEGQVLSFDRENVVLFANGMKTIVPRKSIPKHFKIGPGKHVYAVVDSKSLREKINRKLKKQKK